MDWKNILLGAAGAIAAPFTGGASLALIPAALSGHAAQTATNQQVQAGQQAQGQLAQIQQQANASLAPFAALGANAAGELNSRLGFGSLPTNLASAASRPMTGPQGQAFTTVDPGNPNGTVTNGKAPLVAPPDLADVAGKGFLQRAAAQSAQRSATASGYTGASGRMVTLRAPDGTTESVPAELAQHYVSKGAQIVKVL